MSRLHTKRLARRTQSRGESWWTQRCWSARCCDPVRSCNICMQPLLNYLTKTNKKLFIAGDFNINLLKLDHHLQTSNFLNTMASFKLIPVILRPTRITEFTATLIDNIYTNSNQKMDSCILVEDI